MAKLDSTNTIVASGIIMEGKMLKGTGTLIIYGKYIGEIDLDGKIEIGKSGVIEGNLKARAVHVEGTILGDIFCDNEIHLAPTASVEGNISSSSIIIDSGAIFIGQCKNIKHAPVKLNENSYSY